MSPQSNTPSPQQTLLVLRIIWGAMLMGILVFAFAAIALAMNENAAKPAMDEATTNLLFYISIGLVVVLIPLAMFMRGQIHKSGWVGDVVTPSKYAAGNIIAFALCEGPAFFSLIVVLLTHSIVPQIVPGGVAVLFLILMFPNGRAMFAPADASLVSRTERSAEHDPVTER
ncbi:MAG: hypothetical protein GC162_11695 [Planctomycetes bacterium]|nr:hypothetical protein [Planctomycetota bacterium]